MTLITLIVHVGRDTLPWIAAALLLYVITLVITMTINVRLNDGLKAAGEPDRIVDLAATRKRFDEPRWAKWNLVRALTTSMAFGLLAWALVLYGRST